MNTNHLNTVYFLGVGGIGMSALARYFLAKGCEVYGYDKTETELTRQLEIEGIKIHYKEDITLLKELFNASNHENQLVCYTPAIPKTNREFQFFEQSKIEMHKRSEVLGFICENYFTIAIAGTHGKTTTSSMVAHILKECNKNCIAFLGGISLNFESNLLLNSNADTIVVEADEYDRSFLTLSPDIALITSLDADHLDIYGDNNHMQDAYKAFAAKIKKSGSLITKPLYINSFSNLENTILSTYSIAEEASYYAKDLVVKNGAFYTDLIAKSDQTKDVKIGLPGIHNVENAVGAYAIAHQLGISGEMIKKALASYKGVKRRFEYHIRKDNLVYIDDYAHHPSEIEICIKSIRQLYPNKKITGIFQPHLYTRTRDFVNGFADSLSLLDELILMDIYPARELPIDGVTSKIILDKVTLENKGIVTMDKVVNHLEKCEIEVLLTIGAGDIDTLVKPIKTMLLNNE